MVQATIYWLLISVILSLMHLFIGILIWQLKGRIVPIHNLFVNGSLLFFISAITAKSVGEFYKNISTTDHPWSALIAFLGIVFILLPTTAIYGIIVNALSSGATHDIAPEIITSLSFVLAAAAIIYSFTLFLLVVNFSKGGSP
jgi:hypothetical protein